MKITVLIFLLLGSCLTAKASISADSLKKNKISSFTYSKISLEELEMKTCPLDSSASAMYLYDSGENEFSYGAVRLLVSYKRALRIKFFKNSGYDYATFKINALKSGNNLPADIFTVTGITYNLENGKIVQDTLEAKATFKKDLSDRVCQYVFTMPKVKEGSVIELMYVINSNSLFNMQGWTFQHSIPVKWSIYEFICQPNTLEFKALVQHKDPLVIDKESFQDNGILGLPRTVFQWAMADLQAFKDEPYLTTKDDFIDKLELQISKSLATEGSIERDFSSTWEGIRNTLMKDDDFGKDIKSFGKLREAAKAIEAQKLDKLTTVKQAFEFVRKNIHWNEDESLTTDKAIKKVVETGIGNSAEINLCLLSLLKKLDIEAIPVILSTRSHGRVPSEPFMKKFNYVIVYVNIDGKDWLLDATDPYLDMGVLPIRCLNQRGYLLDKKEGRWLSLAPVAKQMQFTQNDFVLTAENEWKGTLIIGGQGYFSQSLQEEIMKTGLEKYKDDFRKKHPELDIAKVEINYKEANKPELVCNLKTSEGIQAVGDRLYLKPIISSDYDRNPFQYPTREYPVDFAAMAEDTYLSNLEIPAGYIIEEMPSAISLALPNASAKFSFSITKTDDKLSIMSRLQIKKTIFETNEYSALRSFYEQIMAKHQEMIVLKKKP